MTHFCFLSISDDNDAGDSSVSFKNRVASNWKPGPSLIIDPFRRIPNPGFSLYGRRRSISVLSEVPEYPTWNPEKKTTKRE